MKILFICHELSGGGTERVCVDLANGLSESGHEVAILADLLAPISYGLNQQVKLYPLHRRKNLLWDRILNFWVILNVIRKWKPNAIVSFMMLFASLAKLASKLTVNCPVIGSDHNSFERPKGCKMSLRLKVDKFLTPFWLDGLTVLTQADKNYLKGRFKNVVVMYNPLTFEPLKNLPAKERTILAVGRLDAWHYKGFDLLLNAWNKVGRNYSDWKLKIVGHGKPETVSYLRSLVDGIENVEILPFTKNIQEEYQNSAVFVLSSRYEGFGLVLAEAMSQGCACIACNYGGRQTEIVTDGVNGLLCNVDDEEMLTSKLELILKDASLRTQLQHNALRALDKFSRKVVVDRWIELLTKIVEK